MLEKERRQNPRLYSSGTIERSKGTLTASGKNGRWSNEGISSII